MNPNIDRIADQKTAIEQMNAHRAAVGRDIAARQDLLNQYMRKLPERERAEFAKIQEGMNQIQSGNLAAAI